MNQSLELQVVGVGHSQKYAFRSFKYLTIYSTALYAAMFLLQCSEEAWVVTFLVRHMAHDKKRFTPELTPAGTKRQWRRYHYRLSC